MKRLQAVIMAAITFVIVVLFHQSESAAADGRDGYHSDSNARYLHRIPLYDIDNQKITPESTRPFSSLNTCGRCHDYESIAHGWHFNAFAADMGRKSVDGRPGEPWIWTDARTGTQLPLSYRAWDHTFDPADLGLSSFEMTKQFGGRLPGGGVAADVKESSANRQATLANETSEDAVGRWALSGAMEIDCMVCHAVSGQYDFDQRREQIAAENFAWAATAALRLGQVSGSVARIRDGFDPEDEAVKAKLPVVQYEGSRFGNDGTVFMDLVREPQNNACYQCHSTRMVDETGIQPRWVHDDDVHLRAGMNCVDCHRNGIDHHIVRGFDGEQHPAADATAAFTRTLSCRGCHLGSDDDNPADVSTAIHQRAGRLGSPRPLHAGLPPLHFEKLACTACHAGPIPRDEALGVLTSLAHALGEKGHRTGNELPRLVGPVFTKDQDCRVAPHKAMWPAYWGKITDGKLQPISPTKVYDVTRRTLRVRSDFRGEILMPKLKSSDLKEVLGEDRARTRPDDWSDEERSKVKAKQIEIGGQQFAEKVYAALEAIESELDVEIAAYVSSGIVYTRGETEDTLREITLKETSAIDMIAWPMVHNVRPAGWSLGVKGCVECHQDDGVIFASTVTPVGPVDGKAEPVSMAELQGVDTYQRMAWNQMFSGRSSFKYVIGGSLIVMMLAMVAGVGAFAGRISARRKTT